jgi:hypothetical protein
MSAEIYDIHHTTQGKVRVALDNETYLELTPKAARTRAMELLLAAAAAEGKPRPRITAIREILNQR